MKKKAACALLILFAPLGCADALDDEGFVILPVVDSSPPNRDASNAADGGIGRPMDMSAPMADSQPSVDAGVEPRDAMPNEPDFELPPDPGINTGWIGGPCTTDEECDYEEGYCLSEDEGYPRGMCSLDCDRICPDRDGLPVTFCIGGVTAQGGACVQRCDYNAFVSTGCRPGYRCETRNRFNQSDVGRGVCVPGMSAPPEPTGSDCVDELTALGVDFQLLAPMEDTPADAPNLRCRVPEPVRFSSPFAGISFQYLDRAPGPVLASCELALSIHRMADLLRELDIVTVRHMGVYNCRTLRNPAINEVRISQHGMANALDIAGLVSSQGVEYNVLRDWEHNVVSNWEVDESAQFRTEKGRFLYRFARALVLRRIINLVLTPEFNDLHHDHFHIDLTPGGYGIASEGSEPGCGH